MIHLSFYVPATHLDSVKAAVFAAGGGRIGNYESCCFEIRGVGQFKPMSGSQPFVGQMGQVEVVDEVKVEMVCAEENSEKVIEALKHSHPYETPAYYAIKTVNL